MGFKNIEAVCLFGYGGSVLPETDIHLLADDLPEQPLWRDGDNLFFYANNSMELSTSNRMMDEHNIPTL